MTRILIIKIGAEKATIDFEIFNIPIQDNSGDEECFQAYGIDRIPTKIEPKDVKSLAHLFKVDKEEVRRPVGEIDMLIGFEYSAFHPEKIDSIDHLLLMKNKFDVCLGGSHSH